MSCPIRKWQEKKYIDLDPILEEKDVYARKSV